jgi:ElaB/YqjD/DUF883 family membrane-anchored ribosome-binding protein
MVEQPETTTDGPSDREAQGPAAESGELQGSMKEFGVDTDRMIEATSERVNDLQQMLIDEVQARPLRALGWAAAAGFVLGIMAAR